MVPRIPAISGGAIASAVVLLGFVAAPAWAARPVCGDGVCSGAEVCDGTRFCCSSFNYNNENGVRILSPTLAQAGRAVFDSVWNDPQNAGLVGCIHPGESYNQNSKALHRCNDSFDNDFDGLTDLADPACASYFTCIGGGSCKSSGQACSSGSECCSGTCLHGKTRTCQ